MSLLLALLAGIGACVLIVLLCLAVFLAAVEEEKKAATKPERCSPADDLRLAMQLRNHGLAPVAGKADLDDRPKSRVNRVEFSSVNEREKRFLFVADDAKGRGHRKSLAPSHQLLNDRVAQTPFSLVSCAMIHLHDGSDTKSNFDLSYSPTNEPEASPSVAPPSDEASRAP